MQNLQQKYILIPMNNDSQTLRWEISKGNPEGNIMQNRSLTTMTYPDVSTDFLALMRLFHKFIST